MLLIRAGKAELCLQRDIVGQASVKTLLDGILRRIDKVIDELQPVAVPRILNREYFLEDLVQSFILPVLRGGFQLEEILEGLQLHLQKIRVLQDIGCCKVDTLVDGLF